MGECTWGLSREALNMQDIVLSHVYLFLYLVYTFLRATAPSPVLIVRLVLAFKIACYAPYPFRNSDAYQATAIPLNAVFGLVLDKKYYQPKELNKKIKKISG